MSNIENASGKNVIFITPEELEKLPKNSTVYVLSTERGKHRTSDGEENSEDSKTKTTPTSSANASASSIVVHPSSLISPNLPSQLACKYRTSTCTLPSNPPVLYPVATYFPPPVGSTSYPLGFPFAPPMVAGSYSSWFRPPIPFLNHPIPVQSAIQQNSVCLSLGITSTVPPNTKFPIFNPSEPPPVIVPGKALLDSQSLTEPVPSLTTKRTDATAKCPKDQISSRAKSESIRNHDLITPLQENKSTEPIRYGKLVAVPAPEYFCLHPLSGCYDASEKLKQLEDRFENEVLARRLRATENQPTREPLDRRAPCVVSHARRKSQTRKKLALSDCVPQSDSRTDFRIFEGFSSSSSAPSDGGEDNNEEENDEHSETTDGIQTVDSVKRKRGQYNLIKSSGDPTQSDEHKLVFSRTQYKHPKRKKMRKSLSGDASSLASAMDDASGLLNAVGGHTIGQRSIRQQREVAYKLSHPNRLHPDIWHNETHEFNDGPACLCKPKYRIGPLHNQYEGEELVPTCVPESNNRNRLYHYRVIVSPTTNFVQPVPTKISYEGQDYVFDGFSIFLHYKLDNVPPCQILRFNLLYDIFPVEEEFPEFFSVRALDLLTQYLFVELLELLDLSWRPVGVTEGCPVVHLMPRFIHLRKSSVTLPLSSDHQTSSDQTPTSYAAESELVAEILPVNAILDYLLREALTPVIDVMQLSSIQKYNNAQWSNYIADLRGTLATFPGKKPAAIRIDQLDRRSLAGEPSDGILIYPLIVHMTYTPMKLSLTREPKYKSVLKNFMKLQYLMMNKPKITPTDRAQLAQLANELEDMEHSGVHRREITVELSSEGFYRTGIRPDISQHALNLVSLVSHLRFHKSLESLENRLDYSFRDKSLLHQALTHPSYRRTNFGTNQDHFQNSLVSCGPRILEYGDKLQLYKAWRKKGLTKMIQVMSVLPKMHEERSNIYGNERLEFLGDAVIEVISSIHLFFMFPELPEGHLDAYRQAIVQNQHLAELAIRLGIHKFLLYTHSVDFCYDSTFIYARSDAFEALMAAIALDAGLDIVDRIFGAVLFGDEDDIHRVWVKIPPHPLQAQYPNGDRSWATKVPMLKKLPILEEDLGITFKHLRVLARAMTIRKTGFNFYTFGDNQRLEFLGDSLLKYVSTDYLFRHFPRHHEGHLSLLKNSLVNKYTQAAVCSELGLDQYVIRREDNSVLKPSGNGDSDRTGSGKPSPVATSLSAQNQNVKYKADLLEAFVGALFVDKDLVWVERFCQVCFWPRLVEFILKQEWNDAKSKLQQCCLTFRSLHEEPEIAHYKVLDHSGPTNQRTYLVGVYFRGQRLATGKGRSVQQAQMEAAKRALELHQDTFRQLDFQRSVISRRYRQPYIDKMLDHVQNWDERLVDYFIHGDKPGPESEKTVANDSPSNTAADFVQFLRQDPKRKGSDQLKLGETSHSQSHSLVQSNASVRSARQSQAFTKSSKDRVCRRSLETGETGGAEMSQSVSECMSEEGEIQDEDEDMNDNETTDDDNETVNSNLGNRNRFRSVPNQNVALKDSRRRGTEIESGNSGTKSRYRRSLPSGTLADLFTSRGTR